MWKSGPPPNTHFLQLYLVEHQILHNILEKLTGLVSNTGFWSDFDQIMQSKFNDQNLFEHFGGRAIVSFEELLKLHIVTKFGDIWTSSSKVMSFLILHN